MVFPVVMYGCESWIIKKAERGRIDAFELCCWRRLLRVPWTAKRSSQSILQKISLEYSLKGLMLKLKLQYFGHPKQRTNSLRPHGQASLSITNSRSLLKLMSIMSVMPSNHLILCRPLLLLPSIPPSIRVFSNESTLPMRWLKYWSFSFSISPSKEIPGLISFRKDWLDLRVVQGTLKSLLQHHSSKHQFVSAQPSSQSNSHIHT